MDASQNEAEAALLAGALTEALTEAAACSEPNEEEPEGWSGAVADLERLLFEAFPREWAEPWDRPGLLVGDPGARVGRIAFALDATRESVRAAAECGANVLVTHHPAYLEPPSPLVPRGEAASLASTCVWEAVARGVSLVAMHTNLDRSPLATALLPSLLGLAPACGIESGRDPSQGRLGSVACLPTPESLGDLAGDCLRVFGRVGQVFGNPGQTVSRVAFFTGSLGDSGSDALRAGADAVVCGECGYHRALDLTERGCAVILLGHDVSELPLVGVLMERVVDAGVPLTRCVALDEGERWFSVTR